MKSPLATPTVREAAPAALETGSRRARVGKPSAGIARPSVARRPGAEGVSSGAAQGTAPSRSVEMALHEAETRFHTRDLSGAETSAREAIALGASARGHYLLGLVLFAGKRFAQAAESFAEVVKLDPDNQAAGRQFDLARDAARREK
jgi:hypothetical protein